MKSVSHSSYPDLWSVAIRCTELYLPMFLSVQRAPVVLIIISSARIKDVFSFRSSAVVLIAALNAIGY
jgi:hypothetical protein